MNKLKKKENGGCDDAIGIAKVTLSLVERLRLAFEHLEHLEHLEHVEHVEHVAHFSLEA